MKPERVVRLSIGLSPAMKTVSVVLGLVFAAMGGFFALFVWLGVGMFERTADSLGEEQSSFFDPFTSLFTLMGLCGLPFALLGLYVASHALRQAAWLDGTRAYVRGALLTRSADLATADISAGAVRYRENRPGPYDAVHRIPAIVARDRDTGRSLKIPLRGRGLDLLPRAELVALADALTAGRPAGPEHKTAHAIAARLQQLADDPLAV